MAKRSRRHKKKNNNGRLYMAFMVAFLVVVMVVQLGLLYSKSKAYSEREAQLQTELSAQEDRAQELADYEQYTKSEEYIRSTAKRKLGLVSPNEIIFREKKN